MRKSTSVITVALAMAAVLAGGPPGLPGTASAATTASTHVEPPPGPRALEHTSQPPSWENRPWRKPPGPQGPDTLDRPEGPDRPSDWRRAGPPDALPSAEIADAVVPRLNWRRVRANCPPVRPHPDLTRAARGHSRAMARSRRLSHAEPDGSDVSDRVAAAGYDYRTAAENLVAGPPDAEAAVRSWMESAEHRRSILNCAFSEVGVAVVQGPGGPWWTLLLASPS